MRQMSPLTGRLWRFQGGHSYVRPDRVQREAVQAGQVLLFGRVHDEIAGRLELAQDPPDLAFTQRCPARQRRQGGIDPGAFAVGVRGEGDE